MFLTPLLQGMRAGAALAACSTSSFDQLFSKDAPAEELRSPAAGRVGVQACLLRQWRTAS